jgi:hypothetical protein
MSYKEEGVLDLALASGCLLLPARARRFETDSAEQLGETGIIPKGIALRIDAHRG